MIPTSDLIPYARNHNKHPDSQIKQIAASINEFGFTNPVIVSADNVIRAGHGRVLAAEKLGIDSIPCLRFSEWTPTQAQAYVIVDNQLARNSEIDDEMLKIEVAELSEAEFDIALLGLDQSIGKNEDAEIKNNSGELDESNFSNFDHTCPKCGFEFDDK